MSPPLRALASRPLSRAPVLLMTAALLAACSAGEAPDPADAMPSEETSERQPYTLSITAPSAGWSFESVEAYRVDDRAVWIVCRLRPPQGMAAQVISTLEKTLRLPHTKLPRRVFVIGKTWNWEADDGVQYVESRDAIADTLRKAAPIPLEP